jgi:hypothetical protein
MFKSMVLTAACLYMQPAPELATPALPIVTESAAKAFAYAPNGAAPNVTPESGLCDDVLAIELKPSTGWYALDTMEFGGDWPLRKLADPKDTSDFIGPRLPDDWTGTPTIGVLPQPGWWWDEYQYHANPWIFPYVGDTMDYSKDKRD